MLRKTFYVLMVALLVIGTGVAHENKEKKDHHNGDMGNTESMDTEGMKNMDMGEIDMEQMQGMMQMYMGMMQMHMGMVKLGKLPAVSPKMKEEVMSLIRRHMSLMKEHMANGMMEDNMMGGNMNGKMQMEKDISIGMDSSMMGGCSLDGECSGQEESDSAERREFWFSRRIIK